MKVWIQRIATLLCVAALGYSLTACNTIKGMGKDIQRGGQAIEDAAK